MNADQNESRDLPLTGAWDFACLEIAEGLIVEAECTPATKRAMRAILAELLVVSRLWPLRYVSYSRRKQNYSKQDRYRPSWFTYARVTAAVDELERLGLIEHDKAYPGRWGMQSRMRMKNAGGRIVTEGVRFVAVERELIVLRDECKRDSQYADTCDIRRWRANLRRINASIRDLPLCVGQVPLREGEMFQYRNTKLHAVRTTYRRVFSGDFGHGGRFYGPSYQNLKKWMRRRLMICGEQTIELDYSCLHPRLIYAAEGIDPPADSYALGKWSRKRAKIAFNIMLNADSRASASQAIAQMISGGNKRAGKRRFSARAYKRANALVAAVMHFHRGIGRWFFSGVGRRLQFLDSEIAQRVMLGMLKRRMTVLSVHDSFIAPISQQAALKSEMDKALAWMLERLRKRPTLLGRISISDPQEWNSLPATVSPPLSPGFLDIPTSVVHGNPPPALHLGALKCDA